jgi:hypothetical protein
MKGQKSFFWAEKLRVSISTLSLKDLPKSPKKTSHRNLFSPKSQSKGFLPKIARRIQTAPVKLKNLKRNQDDLKLPIFEQKILQTKDHVCSSICNDILPITKLAKLKNQEKLKNQKQLKFLSKITKNKIGEFINKNSKQKRTP